MAEAYLGSKPNQESSALALWWDIFSISLVALSTGQGSTPISISIHYNQPERTAVACFGS
jgi:hypothetical protein